MNPLNPIHFIRSSLNKKFLSLSNIIFSYGLILKIRVRTLIGRHTGTRTLKERTRPLEDVLLLLPVKLWVSRQIEMLRHLDLNTVVVVRT